MTGTGSTGTVTPSTLQSASHPFLRPRAPEKSRVVLHIGTHKTATTTIQDTFWENSALLAEHGVIYPRIGRVTGHHGLVADWVKLPDIYTLPEGSRAALSRLVRDYADKPVTLFLSSEEFSRGDPNSSVDFVALREILSGFDEIMVMCSLRPQWEFIQSVYLEVSKYRSPARPPVIIEQALSEGMVEGLWVNYVKLLDALEQAFPPEDIVFLNFHDARRSEGGILGTYLRELGVYGINASDLTPVNDGASNVSPLPLTGWVANVLIEPDVASKTLLRIINDAIHAEFPERMQSCLFTREEFRKLEAHFQPFNDEIENRRSAVQKGFKITPPDITPLTIFRNAVPAGLWVRVARRLAMHMKDMSAGQS